jgi:peptidoglycan/xylan/chitin deacetylase (PgdA/CDA1 family)
MVTPDIPFKPIAMRLLRVGWVGEAVRRIGVARGHSLVLVYHRVGPCRSQGEIVPCVPDALFRRHVEILGELGEVASLDDLLEGPPKKSRASFALTFDDDYATHFTHVLPTLREFGVTATFFLSGRALHGLGSYWFELLEALIESKGVRKVAELIGTPVGEPSALAAACEVDVRRQQLIERSIPDAPRQLLPEQIRELADAGMTIGFHTLQHPLLTSLSDIELRRALSVGREELAMAAARSVQIFAYPHGRADDRVARFVGAAAYAAAWTGHARPMRATDDRYLLGRWEPGRLDVDDFVASIGIRLNRTSPRGDSRTSHHA